MRQGAQSAAAGPSTPAAAAAARAAVPTARRAARAAAPSRRLRAAATTPPMLPSPWLMYGGRLGEGEGAGGAKSVRANWVWPGNQQPGAGSLYSL